MGSPGSESGKSKVREWEVQGQRFNERSVSSELVLSGSCAIDVPTCSHMTLLHKCRVEVGLGTRRAEHKTAVDRGS